MGTQPVLEVRELRFYWPGNPLPCLDIELLEVSAGEAVFLHGPSGCGKSTLLSLLAGVLLPQAGDVRLMGQGWRELRAGLRDPFRANHVGYIFQQFNLLPYLSVVDNVMAPCRFSAVRGHAAVLQSGSVQADAHAWLDGMGLARSLWGRQASELSVGQQQRVAGARALIGRPALVIADEPTSALDEERREGFMDLLLSACTQARSALVFVSHDQRLAARFQRHIRMPQINRANLASGPTSPSEKPLASAST